MKDAPLRETIGLVVFLALLALPLTLLTGGTKVEQTPSSLGGDADEQRVAATVSVRAAHEFEEVILRRDGEELGRLEGPAKEGEIECLLGAEEDWLRVEVSLVEKENVTAVALEFWPEGLPTVERTFWGEDRIVEEVKVRWLDE